MKIHFNYIREGNEYKNVLLVKERKRGEFFVLRDFIYYGFSYVGNKGIPVSIKHRKESDLLLCHLEGNKFKVLSSLYHSIEKIDFVTLTAKEKKKIVFNQHAFYIQKNRESITIKNNKDVTIVVKDNGWGESETYRSSCEKPNISNFPKNNK